MKQHAEAIANRAPLKMMIPGFMMTIGFFILLLTPPAMEIANFRRDNVLGNIKEEGKNAIDEANRGLNGAQNVPPPPESP